MCCSNRHGATFTFPFLSMKCIDEINKFIINQNHWVFRNCPDCNEFTIVSGTRVKLEREAFDHENFLRQLEAFNPII